MNFLKLAIAAFAVLLAFSSNQAQALQSATATVTANVAFDTPLSLTKVSDINFGYVKAGVSGTYVIDTAGAITPSGNGVWLYGTHNAGSYTIIGSASQTIDIAVSAYTADHGVTPSAATCAYNGGSAAACSYTTQVGPGTGKPLLLGVQIVADGTQAAASTAAPTFDLTVTYD